MARALFHFNGIYLLLRVEKDTRKASETANDPVSYLYSVKHNSSYGLFTAQKGFIAPVLVDNKQR